MVIGLYLDTVIFGYLYNFNCSFFNTRIVANIFMKISSFYQFFGRGIEHISTQYKYFNKRILILPANFEKIINRMQFAVSVFISVYLQND